MQNLAPLFIVGIVYGLAARFDVRPVMKLIELGFIGLMFLGIAENPWFGLYALILGAGFFNRNADDHAVASAQSWPFLLTLAMLGFILWQILT